MTDSASLSGKRVAMPVEDEFEDRELTGPLGALRRILVDDARDRGREKRGGAISVTSLDEHEHDRAAPSSDIDLLALDEALTRLAAFATQQSRIVELRFFSGLTVDEAAEALGISAATVKREWAPANAWLYQQLSES